MIWQILALATLILWWYVALLYLVALIRKDNTIADIGWGPGIALITLAALWWQGLADLRQVLVTVLVTTWAFRLSFHILMRQWGSPEDWRYARLRQRWGDWSHWHSFFKIFLQQGFLMLVVALPVLVINSTSGPALGRLDILAGLIWLIGFMIESISDYQLTRFLKQPINHGKILKKGLWRYSRHPNYFGEIVQWWGIWLLAVALPGGWLTIIGPLTITFLIIKVSGVPMLEAKQKRNPDFVAHSRKTNTLIPWPVRLRPTK